MNITITQRLMRNQRKLYYSFEWGKKCGQRKATGIFTYTHPVNKTQDKLNKEALRILEIKKSGMIMDAQGIGAGLISKHRLRQNFLDFYSDYVKRNKRIGKRHLECSLMQFKHFIGGKFLSPMDVTEELCLRFRKYLLAHLNGETPANYFARFKQVIKAATKQGYLELIHAQISR